MNAASSPPDPATVASTLPDESWRTWSGLWRRRTNLIAGGSLLAILVHLLLRYVVHADAIFVRTPLLVTLFLGGGFLCCTNCCAG